MKSKLILTIAGLAALALPAMAAENNFRDRDHDRDRSNVTVRADETRMRHVDFDELRSLYGDRYLDHSILVSRDDLHRADRARRERGDRDRRDRDEVCR